MASHRPRSTPRGALVALLLTAALCALLLVGWSAAPAWAQEAGSANDDGGSGIHPLLWPAIVGLLAGAVIGRVIARRRSGR